MSSKKRKHAEAADDIQDYLNINVSSDASKDGLKPLLASAPSVPLPRDAALTLYEKSKEKGKGKDKEKSKGRAASMLHGESSKLEWTSSNRLFGLSADSGINDEEDALIYDGDVNEDPECSASYALAIYDPSSGTLSTISTPLHIMSHIPKRLKNLPSLVTSAPGAGPSNMAARAELGLSFGTKKSIRAIRAAERNKVDAGAKDLQDLKDVVLDNLDAGLETLANSQTVQNIGEKMGLQGDEAVAATLAEAAVDAARKAGRPVPNITAERPEDVYPLLNDIITQKEYEAINPSGLLKLSAEDRVRGISMLPYRKSTWVNDRIKDCVGSTSMKSGTKRKNIKVLLFISALMQLRSFKGGMDSKDEDNMRKKFGRDIQPDCIASLLERFTEGIRGTSRRQVTEASDSRILSNILCAALYYESYTTLDFQLLGNDMSVTAKKTTDLLKALGCRIIVPKGTELDKIVAAWKNTGRSTETVSAGKLKVASLLLPLEFPKEKRAKAPARK